MALAPPKTQTSYRTVPLAATVADVLAAHLSRWPINDEPGLVFTNERGAPIQQHPFADVFEAPHAEPACPDGRRPTTSGTTLPAC